MYGSFGNDGSGGTHNHMVHGWCCWWVIMHMYVGLSNWDDVNANSLNSDAFQLQFLQGMVALVLGKLLRME